MGTGKGRLIHSRQLIKIKTDQQKAVEFGKRKPECVTEIDLQHKYQTETKQMRNRPRVYHWKSKKLRNLEMRKKTREFWGGGNWEIWEHWEFCREKTNSRYFQLCIVFVYII